MKNKGNAFSGLSDNDKDFYAVEAVKDFNTKNAGKQTRDVSLTTEQILFLSELMEINSEDLSLCVEEVFDLASFHHAEEYDPSPSEITSLYYTKKLYKILSIIS